MRKSHLIVVVVALFLVSACGVKKTTPPDIVKKRVQLQEQESTRQLLARGRQLVASDPALSEQRIEFYHEQKLLGFFEHGLIQMRTDRGIERMRRLYPAELLSSQNLSGKRILDLGCGDGQFVLDLREQDFDAWGIDLYLDPERAKSEFLAQEDLLKLSSPDRSFDLIFCSFVLIKKDIVEPEFFQKGLEEALRVTKPGGQIYLMPVLLETESLHELMSPFEGRVEYSLLPIPKAGDTLNQNVQVLVLKVLE